MSCSLTSYCYIVDYVQDTMKDGLLPPPPPQLYDTDEDVAMEALDVLDEACEEEVSSSMGAVLCAVPVFASHSTHSAHFEFPLHSLTLSYA